MFVLIFSMAVLGQGFASQLSIVTPGGVSPGASRIVGGAATSIERYPYTVQLFYQQQFLCGGSLITRMHVLTSAHCFILQNVMLRPVDLRVRAGTTYLQTGGQTFQVSDMILHPSYNNPINDNDVAILVLSSLATLGTLVQTASIPPQGWALQDNSPVIHVGWGVLYENSEFASRTLQEVLVYSVNREICRQRYANLTNMPNLITSNMICAGLLDVGGRDACQGDSGGPLIYQSSAGHVVVGITSFGEGCARADYPGVSARVSSYTNWITNTVNQYGGNASSHPSSVALLMSSIIAMLLAKY